MAGTAGRSGRRPKPTARKALAGNPGKRALNKDEPVFTPIKGVEPPEWFAEEDLPLATIMWQLTTKELCGQGLLCVTDLAVLERWCVAYEFLATCREKYCQTGQHHHRCNGRYGQKSGADCQKRTGVRDEQYGGNARTRPQQPPASDWPGGEEESH